MILLTGYTREIAELAEICLPSKQRWAERWGLQMRVLAHEDFMSFKDCHPSFAKLAFIHATLTDTLNPVFWMDADSIITNPTIAPWVFLEKSRNLTVSADYVRPELDARDPKCQWSAGHMLWMPGSVSERWLDEAFRRDRYKWSGLWDQDALQEVQREGRFGYPNIMPTRFMNSVLPGLTGWDQADWQPGDFLVHLTGMPLEARADAARKFLAENV